jgi:hypothetical protein
MHFVAHCRTKIHLLSKNLEVVAPLDPTDCNKIQTFSFLILVRLDKIKLKQQLLEEH